MYTNYTIEKYKKLGLLSDNFGLSGILNSELIDVKSIISGYYKEYLFREPDESGLNYWIKKFNETKGDTLKKLSYVRSGIIYSSEGNKCSKIVKEINSVFTNVLNRLPDKSELYTWVNNILRSGKSINDLETYLKNIKLAENYLLNQNIIKIKEFYRKYLNREPDESGLNYWINKLKSGMSISDIESNFYNSYEYQENLRLSKFTYEYFNSNFSSEIANKLGISVKDTSPEIIYKKFGKDRGKEVFIDVQTNIEKNNPVAVNNIWNKFVSIIDNFANLKITETKPVTIPVKTEQTEQIITTPVTKPTIEPYIPTLTEQKKELNINEYRNIPDEYKYLYRYNPEQNKYIRTDIIISKEQKESKEPKKQKIKILPIMWILGGIALLL
ncbi:MAG: DUF4214 domain-containing protein [Candidatus Omnitrophica bacterium]|nr:DUF4214 domain-containing protein [Candidatus Omnitrophota bacterium]